MKYINNKIPIEIPITVSYSISKSLVAKTLNYSMEADEEFNNDTKTAEKRLYSFPNSDLKELFEIECVTLEDLIAELMLYIKEDMKNCAENSGKMKHLKHLLEGCKGWHIDELEVVED